MRLLCDATLDNINYITFEPSMKNVLASHQLRPVEAQ